MLNSAVLLFVYRIKFQSQRNFDENFVDLSNNIICLYGFVAKFSGNQFIH